MGSAVHSSALQGRSISIDGRCRAIAQTPIVLVLDDDISIRESLEALFVNAGWRVELFSSAEELLCRSEPEAPCCLVLDLGLPGIGGLEVQERVSGRAEMPIVFITGQGDIPTSVRAIKAGAVEFLTKPFAPEQLLGVIAGALELSRRALERESELQSLRTSHSSLTLRERQVMALVVLGRMNKQIGGELGICEMTVKAHRGHVMRKVGAKSLAELVNMAGCLGYATAGRGPRNSAPV